MSTFLLIRCNNKLQQRQKLGFTPPNRPYVWFSKTPLSQRLSAGKQIKQGVFELISHYNPSSNFTSKCRALCFRLNIVASTSPSLPVARALFCRCFSHQNVFFFKYRLSRSFRSSSDRSPVTCCFVLTFVLCGLAQYDFLTCAPNVFRCRVAVSLQNSGLTAARS